MFWLRNKKIKFSLRTLNWSPGSVTCDFQQCGILTSVESNEPVHSPYKLRNSKWFSVSSLTLIEYSSHKQRLWSVWAYAQAGLSLCRSHIPHCWKSHVMAHYLKEWICLLLENIIHSSICMLGCFSCFYRRLLTYLKIDFFKKFFQEHCQSVKRFLIQIKTGILRVLIWVQTVCKGYQQTTKLEARKE